MLSHSFPLFLILSQVSEVPRTGKTTVQEIMGLKQESRRRVLMTGMGEGHSVGGGVTEGEEKRVNH